VIKLRDGIVMPEDETFETRFGHIRGDAWRRVRRQFQDITVRRVFTAVPDARLRELAAEAARYDCSYRPVDLSAYFHVEGPRDLRGAANALRNLRGWSDAVLLAYVEPVSDDPGVRLRDNPPFKHQRYLRPAPHGIDAEFAWGRPGGDGSGQSFVDLESGWTLNHQALVAQHPTLLHGRILNSSRSHGTSVLGVVCGADNTVGGAGIASKLLSVKVVSSYKSSRANAIVAAAADLPLGGVLLLESQLIGHEAGGDIWPPLPIEAATAEYDAIRQATAKGITVVECAGNGNMDLDDFRNEHGKCVLKRGVRDSGAIVVGAATAGVPHARLSSSNHGSRVDCYAWGEDISCPDSTDTAPFSVSAYTTRFGSTSGAGAIIAGAALCIQGIFQAAGRPRLDAYQMRDLLSNPSTGTPSKNPARDRIGVMPNLREIIERNGLGATSTGTKKSLTKRGGSK
jgi:hypothetical protein